jgi:hypothetical protein
MYAEEYNGTTTEANFGWDTDSDDLNVFYDVSQLSPIPYAGRSVNSLLTSSSRLETCASCLCAPPSSCS